MDIRSKQSGAGKYSRLQTEEQQRVKKDKLADALRDNLRRRKAAASPSTEIEEGLS